MACVFCEIIAGKESAFKIYEDELFLAILDINPRSLGHCLLLPKRHVSRFQELNERELAGLASSLKKLLDLLQERLQARGFTIAINDGELAGQEVKHLHIHIIPRYRKGVAIIAAFPVIGELRNRLKEVYEVITGAR